ncbi:hypothetical protein JMJ58_09755 [Haloterrigena salifodinae]|uniref:DUF7974 domain-containing protein n=1 Tax=Haloterrigena salifodinae TaxID=2675099 RepID=A0A8T8E5I7_9EURY|nr:hypothetical protein [Haloterrigena salifodinae]QRV17125.1 hypothetical protein JMJ58_09755 [Haloterrigena salifodinae]
MDGPDPRRDGGPERPRTADAVGLERDDSRPTVATFLSSLVPAALARRAVAVSIATDREVYTRDEPVDISVDFKNRLPVPVSVPTPRRRRWGWTIDGDLEGSDERRYVPERPSTFRFRGGERKRVQVTWNGRLERTDGDRRESVVPDPGTYELRAFVATGADRHRPSDETTIRLE